MLKEYDLFGELVADDVFVPNQKGNTRDIRRGEMAEYITLFALGAMEYDPCQGPRSGAVDIYVDVPDVGVVRIQVKGRSNKRKEKSVSFGFKRGFHATQTGSYDYEEDDFDIAACVLLPARRVIFSHGVKRSITYRTKEFEIPDIERITFDQCLEKLSPVRRA